jgi:general secretion pathway protein J
MPNWNRGIALVQRQEALALGIERLVGDLSAAEYVSYAGDNSPPVFRGNEFSVIFVRPALGPNFDTGLELVRLAEIDTRNGPVMTRTRAPFAAAGPDAENPNFKDPVAVVRSPFRIRFAYSSEDGTWRPKWQDLPKLPRAVKITVVDIATGKPLATSTIAVIHAEGAVGCIASKAAACLAGAPPPKKEDGAQPATPRQTSEGRTL